jgi:UDP-N-acetyl-D-mannosaminuronate dehydrogenase
VNKPRKPLKGSEVVVYGVSCKRDSDDVQESPGLDIPHLLKLRGAEVSYYQALLREANLIVDTRNVLGGSIGEAVPAVEMSSRNQP